MHAQDGLAPGAIGAVYYDLAVEAARAQQRGIEDIRAVGGRQDDKGLMRVEAIHLDEDLVQRLFAFVVPSPQACTALAPDRVEFIDEDDTRSALLGSLKEVTHPTRAHTDEHLDELGAGHGEKGHVCFTAAS